MPTFKPEVESVYAGVRRLRRKRRLRVMAVAVVVLAIPAMWIGVGQLNKDKAPAATSTSRKVNVPGITNTLNPKVAFINATTGFAVYDTCHVADSGCGYGAGLTTDGGVTWKSVKLPDIPPGNTFSLSGPSAQEFYVTVREPDSRKGGMPESVFWKTADGGASFTKVTLAEMTSLSNERWLNGYDLECPGNYTDFRDGPQRLVPDPTCTTKVVKIGAGPVPTQPPGIDYTSQLRAGRDGRLWLLTGPRSMLLSDEQGPKVVQLSEDGGKTWKAMPNVPANGIFQLSEDGKDVYYQVQPRATPTGMVDGEVAQLVAGEWVRLLKVPFPKDLFIAPLGGSVLLVFEGMHDTISERVFYLKDGVEVPVPAMIAQAGIANSQLPDGAIQLQGPKGVYLGTGQGTDMVWTFIEY